MQEKLLRPIFTFLLKLFFRIEVTGIEHYHAAGERVVIAVNHQSFLDPLLIAVFMPQKPAFAINVFQADKWYLSWLDKVVTLYRLDPSKPMSMKRLIQDLRAHAKVVIFPEGRITTSGGIMKIYDGTGMILEKTGATLLPVCVDGAEYSKLSRLSHKLRQRWFPKVRITILPPVRFEQGVPVSSRAIYDIMTAAAFATSNYRRPLLAAILEASHTHGSNHIIASDFTRACMSYRQLFTRALILARKLSLPLKGGGPGWGSKPQEDPPLDPPPSRGRKLDFVAVMLPSGLAAPVTFVALHILGKIPCMLNFSAGAANILHACRIATVKTVLTSRQFVEQGKLQPVIDALQKEHTIIYLEDIRAKIHILDKLNGFIHALFLRDSLQDALAVNPDDPAVILYTSGSEGTPKGVALSHANVLANIYQASARLDLMPSDILFNAMPVFHSFGLTVGMLLPLVRGIKTFLYPSPLHYRVIPELVYDTDATIMLGTDTFYQGYAHYAHPYDFWKVRLAVAGAEKLKESTRHLYAEKFGVRIMEGYGVTETSPAVSFNTAMENKPGTVGRPFPAMLCKTEKIEGMAEGGRLFVKGPNVMLGYLNNAPVGSASDSTGSCAIAPQFTGVVDEWYDTGDIVDIDADGFIRIVGRAKRFAKIGGEMVSLAVAEELAADLFPDAAHAAITIPDERKGEQIVLFTETKDLTRETLLRHAREKSIAELCLPKQVIFMEAIPRLGTGKVDYVTLGKASLT